MDTLQVQLYRNDAFYILMNGKDDLKVFKDHLNGLHPNLTWTVECGSEGGYLALWLMLEMGE